MPGPDEPGRERRSAAHVEGGERDVLGEVVREARPQAGREEDRLALALDPLDLGADGADPVEPQRGERERDERRDPVARARGRPRRGGAGPTAATRPTSMPPEPGDRVVQLAARADDPEDLVARCGRGRRPPLPRAAGRTRRPR